QQVRVEWANFLERLKHQHAPAHATIQDSKPAAASKEALVVAFKYEIHCSLFLEHKEMIESTLANSISNHLTIIPLTEEDWKKMRSEYIQKQEKTEQDHQTAEDPIIEKARELVGDDILEIRD